MTVKIEVELDDSTLNGWNAYDLIKETCSAYGVSFKLYKLLPSQLAQRPCGKTSSENTPPDGYPVEWRTCTEMVRALCDRFHNGVVYGGWDAKFRRGVANAGKPSDSLRRILKRQGLLLADGMAPLWWRISRDFTLLPPPNK